MATTTTNLGLKKPATTDYYNIQDFNDNADTIDTFAGNTITTDKLINNLAATSAGFALDARQGKTIGDRLTTAESNIATNSTNVSNHTSKNVTDSGGVHGLSIENGTFTPIIVDSSNNQPTSYSSQYGYYQKIGTTIFFHLEVNITTKGSSITGNIGISGLPYTSKNNVNRYSSISIGYADHINIGVGKTLTGMIRANSSKVELFISPNDGSIIATATSSILSDGSLLMVSGQYQI